MCSKLWQGDTRTIDEELGKYIESGVDTSCEYTSIIKHIGHCPDTLMSKKQQFLMLSSISNYHWFREKRGPKERPHVLYRMHLLTDSTAKEDTEESSRKYMPASPRNRVMYYLQTEDLPALWHYVKQLIARDEESTYAGPDDNCEEIGPPPRRGEETQLDS